MTQDRHICLTCVYWHPEWANTDRTPCYSYCEYWHQDMQGNNMCNAYECRNKIGSQKIIGKY